MKLLKSIYRFFFFKDISKVLAAFEKPLNDLKKVQEQSSAAMLDNIEIEQKKQAELDKLKERLRQESAVLLANKEKAKTVQQNLEKLLGMDLNGDKVIG